MRHVHRAAAVIAAHHAVMAVHVVVMVVVVPVMMVMFAAMVVMMPMHMFMVMHVFRFGRIGESHRSRRYGKGCRNDGCKKFARVFHERFPWKIEREG